MRDEDLIEHYKEVFSKLPPLQLEKLYYDHKSACIALEEVCKELLDEGADKAIRPVSKETVKQIKAKYPSIFDEGAEE